jgi:hypothetical protein
MLFSKAGAKISVLPFAPNIFLFVIAFVLLKNLLRFVKRGAKISVECLLPNLF